MYSSLFDMADDVGMLPVIGLPRYDEGAAAAVVAAALPTARAGPPGWRRRREPSTGPCPVHANRGQQTNAPRCIPYAS